MMKTNVLQKDFDEIYNLIYNYQSKYKEGLIDDELQDIYSKIPNFFQQLKKSKYISRDTCLVMDNGDVINYRHDIYKKIIFVLRYRNEKLIDFD